MINLKVGQRVRNMNECSYSKGQVGTVLDEDKNIVWVHFDNAEYNNAVATDLEDQPSCTACIVKYLEPIEE